MCVNTVRISRLFQLFRSLLHQTKNITLTFKALQCSSFSKIYSPIFFCLLVAHVFQEQNPTVCVRAGCCRLTSVCCSEYLQHSVSTSEQCNWIQTNYQSGCSQFYQSTLPLSYTSRRLPTWSVDGCEQRCILNAGSIGWIQLLITGLYNEAYVLVAQKYVSNSCKYDDSRS